MGYNEISLPTWQNLVRRIFGLTGAGGNVPLLAPEIQPTAEIQPAAPDHRLFRGEIPFLNAVNVASGAAGTSAKIKARNETSVNRMVIFERIVVHCPIEGVRWGLDFEQGDLTTALGNEGFVRDTRQQRAGVNCYPTAVKFSHAADLLVPLGACITSGFGPTTYEMRDFVLSPGWELIIEASPDQDLFAYFEWYEKPFERSEAQP